MKKVFKMLTMIFGIFLAGHVFAATNHNQHDPDSHEAHEYMEERLQEMEDSRAHAEEMHKNANKEQLTHPQHDPDSHEAHEYMEERLQEMNDSRSHAEEMHKKGNDSQPTYERQNTHIRKDKAEDVREYEGASDHSD